jgi:hypothetical protein
MLDFADYVGNGGATPSNPLGNPELTWEKAENLMLV